MKFLLLTLLFLGFMFIVVGYIKSKQQCPPAKIEYRYIPRTFVEEQENPTPVSEIFAKMFFEPTPWLRTGAGKLRPTGQKNQNLNQFFISQA